MDLFNYVEDHLGGVVIHKLSEQPDVILYGGGVDISPKLYGGKFIKETGQVPFLLRDGMEVFCFQFSQLFMEKMPLTLAICRGAQLVNTLNGGTINPNVEGHVLSHADVVDSIKLDTDHAVEYFGKNKADTFGVRINSLHHQSMIPPHPTKAKAHPHTVLCRTITKADATHPSGEKGEGDIEAIWYPKTRSICIQWHPEYDPKGRSGWLVDRILEDYGELK